MGSNQWKSEHCRVCSCRATPTWCRLTGRVGRMIRSGSRGATVAADTAAAMDLSGAGRTSSRGMGSAEVRFRMRMRIRLTLAGGNGALPCHHGRGRELAGFVRGHRLLGVAKTPRQPGSWLKGRMTDREAGNGQSDGRQTRWTGNGHSAWRLQDTEVRRGEPSVRPSGTGRKACPPPQLERDSPEAKCSQAVPNPRTAE